MVAFLLMGVGGLLLLISLFGLLAFLLEPLYRSFQIAIRQRDDYTHYLTPAAQALLKNARKDLIGGLLALFCFGAVIFFAGYYMQFGPRGLNKLWSTRVDEGSEIGEDPILGPQAEGINSAGNFVSGDGTEYVYYFVIRGTDIFYRNTPVGKIGDLEPYLAELQKENEIYIVDGFAAAKTYRDVIELLEENGFKCRTGEDE